MPSPQTNFWLHGLGSAFITGLSTSGLSALGVTGASAAGFSVPNLNLKQLGVIALMGGVVGALAYLKQSPLPPEQNDTTNQQKDTK